MRNRNVWKHRAVLAGVLTLLPGVCGAQAYSGRNYGAGTGKPLVEMDLDLRSRLTETRSPQVNLYSNTLRLQSNFAAGWRLDIDGGQKSGGLLAQPAGSHFLAQQASVERDWGAHRLQMGIVRVPFGIYDTRETYASGLIDYPLARTDWGWHSVNWGAPGLKWAGNSRELQLEASAFGGRGAGVWNNSTDIGGSAFRAQTFVRGVIWGVSRWDGYVDNDGHKQVHLTGVDMRLTRPHWVVRGEFLFGDMAQDHMRGYYLDLYYHIPRVAPVTLVGRIEDLKNDDGEPVTKQLTLGMRYTAGPGWVFAVNWRKNNVEHDNEYSWTPRSGKHGDVYFQVFRTIRF